MKSDRAWSFAYGCIAILLTLAFFMWGIENGLYAESLQGLWLFVGSIVTMVILSVFALPKERRKHQAICMLLFLAISLVLSGIILPVGTGHPMDRNRSACLSSIRQSALALIIYASDNNDTLPLAESWHTATRPYFKRELGCPISTAPWPFAMNSEASGHKYVPNIDEQWSVLLFEADAQLPNASGGREWLVFRHGNENTFASIAFLDGHARLIMKDRVPSLNWKAVQPKSEKN